MATVYVAGSYARREELFERAKDLVQAGHRVTSRWLKGNAELDKQDQIDMDLVDLMAADAIIVFTNTEEHRGDVFNTGGHHAEFGYALALNHNGDSRRLIIVGWPTNIFLHDQEVEAFPTFQEALEAL